MPGHEFVGNVEAAEGAREWRNPLAEAEAAFEHADRPGALKILVDCR